ncbi:zinc transporter ZIP9-like isoform X2 [Stegodyphus dumicola]|uniref:zinc transporter ZIP9-like isoform X2 n=1 Tax=Stegodyphus dumicola TaxID=202533 RepID=UPI0015B1B1CE|nr:zinc transporter ZIP9-like isoform X2 [Stegodyphus dumicola]
MSEVLVLLFLSSAMLIGCYMAGMIPLIVTLSEDKLQLVSVLGAGLLVGTALSVIIPEGVNTLYATQIKQLDALKHFHNNEVTAKEVNVAPIHTAHGSGDIIEPHSVIGVALVLGFIFMLLIDQISSSHGRKQAPADGIALGAAVTTSHTDIEMIVFTAIMLHKAPAAFGLVTFLMHEGLDRVKIRKHLLVFALAAPVLAILTYFGISQSTKERLSSLNATGIAMLFSAGTFLYVATVHVLPEIAVQSHRHSLNGDNSPDSKGFKKVELLALVVGALLPLLLSIGHHH